MGSTLSADVTIKSWNSKIVGRSCEAGLRAAFEKFGEDVIRQARDNVAPGKGPGPHPHVTEHEDTGRLSASLVKTVEDGAQGPLLQIGFGEIYGVYLELGWTARSGRWYQYRWMMPALEAQAPRLNFYLTRITL